MRHEKMLAANQRMSLQVKNIKRKDKKERKEIAKQAKELRESVYNQHSDAGI